MHTRVSKILEQKGQEVTTITPETSVFEAIKLMAEMSIGSVLVINAGGGVVGILSERDCFRKVCLEEKRPRDVKAAEVMSKKVQYVTPDKTLTDCMGLMTQKRIRHLPVLEN